MGIFAQPPEKVYFKIIQLGFVGLEPGLIPSMFSDTFVSLALQNDISLAAIQKLLDHDRLSTTAIYLNLTNIHVIEEYMQKW